MNILVICPYIPMPDRGSGELRLFSLLRILAARHEVTLYTWSWGQEVSNDEKRRYEQNLVDEGVILESHGLRALLRRHRYDAVIFEWYYSVDWYFDDVKTWQPAAKIIIDTVDLEFRRLNLQIQTVGGLSEDQLKFLKRVELDTYDKADMLIAVSSEEEKLLKAELPQQNVCVIPNIHVFAPSLPPLSREPNIIFIGNFRFNPNLDAVQYFCHEIWPSIRAKVPTARFTIVGNALPREEAVFRTSGIEAIGYVPDTAIYLAQSRVSVAPLRFGAGVKGKVGEAVSFGIPVVTTSIGFQGMPLNRGEDILVADTPADFASAVTALLGDFELCEGQRARAWQRFRSEFGYDAVSTRVRDVFDQIQQIPTKPLALSRRWSRRLKCAFDEYVRWRLTDGANNGAQREASEPSSTSLGRNRAD